MSLAEPQCKALGGVEYEVLPLSSSAALRVMARVLRMASPAFSNVATLRDAASAVGTFLARGLAELDEDTLLYVCGEFAKVTKVTEGERKLSLDKVFDEHFRGRVVEMFEWLRFAGEVTYGPLAAALQKMEQKPAPPAVG